MIGSQARRLAAIVVLCAATLFAVAQEPETAVEEAEKLQPVDILNATLAVVSEIETAWNEGDRFTVIHTTTRFVSGNAVARKLFDNAGYFRWTISVFGLMIVGNIAVLALYGYRIRLMAMTFPRRPLGPALIGIALFILVAPIMFALLVSGVGAPFAVCLCATLFLAAIVGKVAVFVSVGWALMRGAQSRSVLPFFPLYGVYFALVTFDPFALGTAAFLIFNLLGIGLVVRTQFGFGVRPPQKAE